MSKTLAAVGTVNVGDFCYVSPPFDNRGGEPYMVGRIQEFSQDDKSARVAFFLRPRDIGSRIAQHGRRLLATFHSDSVPLSFIRGKCQVLHRDRIPKGEEEAYKRRPDCFYFHQFYDRYLHRYFEIIETSRIKNAPTEVLSYLQSHFEFILCELNLATDICSDLQACDKCTRWVTATDSIRCEMCLKHFHLQCLTPPLLKKPGLGFVFTCAICSLKRDEEMDKYYRGERNSPPPAPTHSTFKKGKYKEVILPQSSEISSSMKMTNGWPFRYFGFHINPLDVLNPHESLYPRAASRIGMRYQTVVSETTQGPIGSTSKLKSNIIDRGADSAVDVYYLPNQQQAEDEEKLTKFIEKVKELPVYAQVGVALLDKALFYWSTNQNTALQRTSKLTSTDLKFPSWSETEIEKLDQGLEEWQEDLEEIAKRLPRKSVADVVNYVYLHRPQVEKWDEGQVDDKYSGAMPTGMSAALHPDQVETEANVEEIEERSIAGDPPLNKCHICAVCETKESAAWYKCPHHLGLNWGYGERVLCKDCSENWRKYGADSIAMPVIEEIKEKKPRKKKDAALEAESSALSRSTSPEPIKLPPPIPQKLVIPPKPCLMCRDLAPRESLAQCKKCTLSAHASCYGIPPDANLEDWCCELCETERRPAAGHRPCWPSFDMKPENRLLKPIRPCQNLSCALCPEMGLPSLPRYKEAMSALDILKPAEDQTYVHLICALWHPELLMQREDTYQNVEGLSLIPKIRRTEECFICNQKDVGACVGCATCHHSFHVSCAWSAGYKFGIQLETDSFNSKRKSAAFATTFMDFEGILSARVWCKTHRIDSTTIVFDIGERDLVSNLTALETFVRTRKLVSAEDDVPAGLRQARYKDALIQSVYKTFSDAEKEAAKEAKEKARLMKIAKAEKVKKQQAKRKATLTQKRAEKAAAALTASSSPAYSPTTSRYPIYNDYSSKSQSASSGRASPALTLEPFDTLASLPERRNTLMSVSTSNGRAEDQDMTNGNAIDDEHRLRLSSANDSAPNSSRKRKFSNSQQSSSWPNELQATDEDQCSQPMLIDPSPLPYDPSLLLGSHTQYTQADEDQSRAINPQAVSQSTEGGRKRKPSKYADEYLDIDSLADDPYYEDTFEEEKQTSRIKKRQRRRPSTNLPHTDKVTDTSPAAFNEAPTSAANGQQTKYTGPTLTFAKDNLRIDNGFALPVAMEESASLPNVPPPILNGNHVAPRTEPAPDKKPVSKIKFVHKASPSARNRLPIS